MGKSLQFGNTDRRPLRYLSEMLAVKTSQQMERTLHHLGPLERHLKIRFYLGHCFERLCFHHRCESVRYL